MERRIFLLTLVVLGLLAIPPTQSPLESQFDCIFPEEPNNIVWDESGSITLVAMNWEGDRQSAVEKAIEKVVPLLEDSPFWPPNRGGTVPVYPANEELIWCWQEKQHQDGGVRWGSFRPRTGPYGPGIYLLPNLDPLALKVALAHEGVHAFWTSDELTPRLVTVPIILNYFRTLLGGSP